MNERRMVAEGLGAGGRPALGAMRPTRKSETLPPEELERRVALMEARAAAGLDLWTGLAAAPLRSLRELRDEVTRELAPEARAALRVEEEAHEKLLAEIEREHAATLDARRRAIERARARRALPGGGRPLGALDRVDDLHGHVAEAGVARGPEHDRVRHEVDGALALRPGSRLLREVALAAEGFGGAMGDALRGVSGGEDREGETSGGILGHHEAAPFESAIMPAGGD